MPEGGLEPYVAEVANEMDLVLAAIRKVLKSSDHDAGVAIRPSDAASAVHSTSSVTPATLPAKSDTPPPNSSPDTGGQADVVASGSRPTQMSLGPPTPTEVKDAEAAASEHHGAIDWNDALANFGGEEAILWRLLQKFEERAKPTMHTIRKAAREKDFRILQREAYSLKGSAGYIAAFELQQAALALEELVRSLSSCVGPLPLWH